MALSDPWYRTLVQAQDTIATTTSTFWSARGVKSLLLPVTTGSISSPMGLGSDSEPVLVELNGAPTYLADSMQFMLEYGCRLSPGGAYYLMPSFRGEMPDATHLNEFFHSEAEIPGELDDVIDAVEAYVRTMSGALVAEHAEDIASVAGDVTHLEDLHSSPASLPRLTFDEAVAVLGRLGGEVRTDPVHGFRTMPRESEQLLMEHCGGMLWLTHFDRLAVPFYQADVDGKAVAADLLMGQGETAGAGQRHTTGAEARAALAAHNVAEEEYAWYVTMKDRYPMLTSGFGLGIERFLLWVFNHDDVRDLQLLPRMRGRVILP
ncbi:amino acid--tRNA ligase-related protein [Lentzea tibetensis]|uniref:amino acid--tRNA ligase-related protein n=1 Tax=Lentzea tibetensis TaxID=2591470 RepID=UPI001F1B8B18|nr:amino acid--tRNA ligase-related protein [Lentzea tibetensis]